VGLDDLSLVDQAAVFGYLPFVAKDEIDFLDFELDLDLSALEINSRLRPLGTVTQQTIF